MTLPHCMALTRAHGAALVRHLHRAQATEWWAHHGVTNHSASLQGNTGG